MSAATHLVIDKQWLTGTYNAYRQSLEAPYDFEWVARDAVHDDFGFLVDGNLATYRMYDEHEACDTEAAFQAYLDAQYPGRHDRAGKVTAVIDEADEWGETRITIGRDLSPDVARYRVRLDRSHDDDLVVTHAQLAALLFAAQEIVRPARPRPAAVRYLARRRS